MRYMKSTYASALLFAAMVSAMPYVQDAGHLDERETACIALGTCPGENGPKGTTTVLAPTASTAPSSTMIYSSSVAAPPSTVSASSSATPTLQRSAMKPSLYACNSQQKQTIQTAWNDAGTLAKAHAQWQAPGWFSSSKWQSAMDLYIGTASQKDNTLFGGPGPVKKNILRQQGIHFDDGTYSPGRSYSYWYCDESKATTSPICAPGVYAYTWDDNGLFWNAKYVVLCPDFFSKGTTLDDMTSQAKSDPNKQKVIEPWLPLKVSSIFHETYHWNPEVSQPKCDLNPEVYDATDVANLAKTDYSSSIINAESYLDAALAIYIQQTFNLPNPPTPRSMAPLDVQAAVPANDFQFNSTTLDAAPAGFIPPVNVQSTTVDPVPSQSGWEPLFDETA